MKAAADELEKHGLTLADIAQAFGPEIAVVSDWEPGGLAVPSLFVAVEVRDAEKAGKFAGLIREAMSMEGKLTEKEYHGAKIWSAKSMLPVIQPTLALDGTHLMFGLNQSSVTAALDHARSGKSALAEAAAFTGALKTVGEPNAGMLYLDSARITGRLYDRARPFLANAIAGNPKLAPFLDASLLPQTATLVRHMPPFIASFQSGMHGFTVESTGPATYVTGVGVVGVVAGFSMTMYQTAKTRAGEKAGKEKTRKEKAR